MMRHLLRIADLTAPELEALLRLSADMKADPARCRESGRGRVAAVLFEKPSLRTRFSVEAALHRIGAHPIGAYDREAGLGWRESIADTARVLGRYVDTIVVRTYEHARVQELAAIAGVPVVNALTDTHHPLQALADLLTVSEAVGGVDALRGAKIAYVGDGNNVCHSLIEACALAGLELAVACPPGFGPDPHVAAWAQRLGATVELVSDAKLAVEGAAAVYTDVWVSMGREDEADARRTALARFRVTAELMAAAAPDAVFLHCLPAHRGEEVDADVIDGPASKVFDQAENRLHTAAALFATIFGAS